MQSRVRKAAQHDTMAREECSVKRCHRAVGGRRPVFDLRGSCFVGRPLDRCRSRRDISCSYIAKSRGSGVCSGRAAAGADADAVAVHEGRAESRNCNDQGLRRGADWLMAERYEPLSGSRRARLKPEALDDAGWKLTAKEERKNFCRRLWAEDAYCLDTMFFLESLKRSFGQLSKKAGNEALGENRRVLRKKFLQVAHVVPRHAARERADKPKLSLGLIKFRLCLFYLRLQRIACCLRLGCVV